LKDIVQVSSFVGQWSKGNAHAVTLVKQFSHLQEALEYSRNITPRIYVEVCTQKICPALRFYHKGREVMNCGSGTLAAARVYLNKFAPEYAGKKLVFSSKTATSEVERLGNNTLGISQNTTAIKTLPQRATTLWEGILGKPLVRLSRVIGKNYLIAELASQRQVEALQPRLRLLQLLSKNALIVTAAAERRQKADYVLRYFAPQYGNPEDAATGSANIFLVQYWWPKFRKPFLKGLQLSRERGEFLGRQKLSRIELYGKTA